MSNFEEVRQRAKAAFRHFNDFPKPGICFWDIMPLFHDPKLVDDLCKAIANHLRSDHPDGIDAITALEARGFMFGPQIAIDLGIPFVPIRKKGKLPGPTIQASYVKEYGVDTVEIQKDALKAGQKVVIIDDLLATGGTLNAAIQLMEKAGTKVVESFVIVELTELKGRQTLPKDAKVVALHSD
uniref:Adenine phosphoribosyltransferase n=1 Tax=Panagrolaimus sp. JU765 TaxID=591449 RepID=A0AC34R0J1_9BILA